VVVAYIDVHTVNINNRTGPISGKKMCVRTHRLRPDAPGAWGALDATWQGTYHSQRETHRQCEFGRSTPWHRVFGRRIPGRRASDTARRGTVHSDAVYQGTVRPDAARHGICLLDGACQGIFLLDAAVSGHFPSGRSRVRAFSFWTQPCQSIFLLGAAVSGQMVSG